MADVVDAWDHLVAVAVEAGECNTTEADVTGNSSQDNEESRNTETSVTAEGQQTHTTASNTCTTAECQQRDDRTVQEKREMNDGGRRVGTQMQGTSRNILESNKHKVNKLNPVIRNAQKGIHSHAGSEREGSSEGTKTCHHRRGNEIGFYLQELQRQEDEENNEMGRHEAENDRHENKVNLSEDDREVRIKRAITVLTGTVNKKSGVEEDAYAKDEYKSSEEYIVPGLISPETQEITMFGGYNDKNWELERPRGEEGNTEGRDEGRRGGERGSKPVTCQATFRHDLVDVTRQMLQVGKTFDLKNLRCSENSVISLTLVKL